MRACLKVTKQSRYHLAGREAFLELRRELGVLGRDLNELLLKFFMLGCEFIFLVLELGKLVLEPANCGIQRGGLLRRAHTKHNRR